MRSFLLLGIKPERRLTFRIYQKRTFKSINDMIYLACVGLERHKLFANVSPGLIEIRVQLTAQAIEITLNIMCAAPFVEVAAIISQATAFLVAVKLFCETLCSVIGRHRGQYCF